MAGHHRLLHTEGEVEVCGEKGSGPGLWKVGRKRLTHGVALRENTPILMVHNLVF